MVNKFVRKNLVSSANVQSDEIKVQSKLGRSSDPPPNPEEFDEVENTDLRSYLSDYHLTVRFRFLEMGRREACLLLSVLNYQVLHFGINFKMYITMIHLFEFLIGNKKGPEEIKLEIERLTCLTTNLILRDLQGTYLTFEDQLMISDYTRKECLRVGLVVDTRVYHSRLSHWRPERWIEIRTVPVDVLLKRSKFGIPYSSYTKGYGEGSGSARKGKTPFSAELDGTEETPIVFSLKEIQKYLTLELLEIRFKSKNRLA